MGLGRAREEVVNLQGYEEDGFDGVVIVPAYGWLLCPRWKPDTAGVRSAHQAQANSQGQHTGGGAHGQGGLGLHEN